MLPALSVGLAATLGRALYGRTLPAVTERYTVGPAPSADTRRVVRPFPGRLQGPVGALIERDVLLAVLLSAALVTGCVWLIDRRAGMLEAR